MRIIDVDPPERFADESDRASFIESVSTAEAIRKRMEGMDKPPVDFDGVHCVVCGNEIPAERLATGAWRDMYCQQVFEKRKKDFSNG